MVGILMPVLLCAASAAHASERSGPPALEPTVTREEAGHLAAASSLFEKDPGAAIKQLRAQTGPKASAALDFALGAMLAKGKRFAEAEKALETALGKLTSFRRAWLLMARVRILRGRTENAVDPLRRALKLGAERSEAVKLLAYCHVANGDAVAAESAYRQVLVLEPRDREATAGLARSLLMQERADDAAPLLRVLCEKTPGRAEYWQLRANIEMARGKNRRAITMLECARRLCKANQQVLLALGDLYFNERLYEKAVSHYSEASTSGKLSTARLVRYAGALLDAGRPLLAEKLIGRKLPADRKHPDRIHLVRAKIALARRDGKSARNHLDAALRARPMSGDALLMLARLQRDGGESERALLTLERASRVKSHKRRALLEIAQIRVDRSQYQKALDALAQAQSMRFDPRVARYAEQIRKARASLE